MLNQSNSLLDCKEEKNAVANLFVTRGPHGSMVASERRSTKWRGHIFIGPNAINSFVSLHTHSSKRVSRVTRATRTPSSSIPDCMTMRQRTLEGVSFQLLVLYFIERRQLKFNMKIPIFNKNRALLHPRIFKFHEVREALNFAIRKGLPAFQKSTLIKYLQQAVTAKTSLCAGRHVAQESCALCYSQVGVEERVGLCVICTQHPLQS